MSKQNQDIAAATLAASVTSCLSAYDGDPAPVMSMLTDHWESCFRLLPPDGKAIIIESLREGGADDDEINALTQKKIN